MSYTEFRDQMTYDNESASSAPRVPVHNSAKKVSPSEKPENSTSLTNCIPKSLEKITKGVSIKNKWKKIVQRNTQIRIIIHLI